MTKLKHILRYINGTKDLKLFYEPGSCFLHGFMDADWGEDTSNRKIYTGFTFFFGGGPISWEYRRKHPVALSSTVAEYMAVSDAAKDAIYTAIDGG